ncbi:MAG: hypothetical protein K6F17_05505 [Lachnospiraceae bacterium]|nr:hypothetical protein [Lachnospiraceae bacterium]
MADIELVIKIPEGLKNDFESEQWTALSCMEMKEALEKATSLPAGHGRLIDENELIDEIVCEEIDGSYYDVIYAHSIYDASTIIEADKAESEGKK